MRLHKRQPIRLPRPWDSPGKNAGVGCHFLLQCMKVKSQSEVAQSCPTLSDPMDCSPPGSSVHGIFQSRVLQWGAIDWLVAPKWQHHLKFTHVHDKTSVEDCIQMWRYITWAYSYISCLNGNILFKEQNKGNSFSKTANKKKEKNLAGPSDPLHRKHFPQKTIKVPKTKLDIIPCSPTEHHMSSNITHATHYIEISCYMHDFSYQIVNSMMAGSCSVPNSVPDTMETPGKYWMTTSTGRVPRRLKGRGFYILFSTQQRLAITFIAA